MPKKKYAAEFKARVASAVLCGEKTVAELSEEFGVPQTLIYKWTKQLKASAASIFSGEPESDAPVKGHGGRWTDPRIGQLTEEERGFLLKVFAKR